MFALDTNTLIYFFKGMGNVAQYILSTPPRDIAIPAIVLYEIEYGIQKSTSPQKRKNQLKQFMTHVTTLPFGQTEAAIAASIKATLEKKGTPIGPHDIMIAATALSGNHTLITHNTNEFQRVEGLNLLDWYI